MIPKKIHYCWFGNGEIPELIQNCMKTWSEFLPEYELVIWDEKKIDINSIPFIKEAYSAKRWAFVSDYVRLFALYTQGGIYLDTDVIVKKNFDEFLQNDFFAAVESFPYIGNKNFIEIYDDGSVILRISGIALSSCIFGSVAGHPFLKDCMDWYQNKHFIRPDGSFSDRMTASDIYATIAQKYGFKYKNEEQDLLENMKIYQSFVLASNFWGFTKDSFAVHCAVGSWRHKSFLMKFLTKNNFIRKLFGRPPEIKDGYSFVQNSPIWSEK